MIAIIDYKAGNLTSVARALDQLGYENKITDDPDTILSAERMIFPRRWCRKSNDAKPPKAIP